MMRNTQPGAIVPAVLMSMALALAGPAQAQAARPAAKAWNLPADVELAYDLQGQIKGIRYIASSVLHWQSIEGGRQYRLRLDTKLPILGTRSQVSEGRITAQGLSPDRYTEQMRRADSATVDRAARQVTFNTDRPAQPWQEGAQDRLSLMLQVGQSLRANPKRYKTGDTVDLQVIGPRHAPDWQFRVDGVEKVKLPAGTVDAVKFTRLPREANDDQVIEFWLSPTYRYMPVRVRWTEDGDRADQLLSRATGLK